MHAHYTLADSHACICIRIIFFYFHSVTFLYFHILFVLFQKPFNRKSARRSSITLRKARTVSSAPSLVSFFFLQTRDKTHHIFLFPAHILHDLELRCTSAVHTHALHTQERIMRIDIQADESKDLLLKQNSPWENLLIYIVFRLIKNFGPANLEKMTNWHFVSPVTYKRVYHVFHIFGKFFSLHLD